MRRLSFPQMNDAPTERSGHGSSAIVNVQLEENLLHMNLDGILTDSKCQSDLLVLHSFPNCLQYFDLARGQSRLVGSDREKCQDVGRYRPPSRVHLAYHRYQ